MPWQQVTPMSEKKEFISLAAREDANISRLCRYFRVSRKTAYKWLGRFRRVGWISFRNRYLRLSKAFRGAKGGPAADALRRRLGVVFRAALHRPD